MLDTAKKWIKDLVAICAAKGMRHVVMSPGSRCAPLVIAFNNHPDIACISIIDERSAAFFAMGMAQQLAQPVGLVCTSGSATLNYAPAVAEAYYSKIPLLLFTADRPNEWIGQADGQAIQQFDIYKNYIKGSFELPSAIDDKDHLWYSNRMVSEAYNRSMIPDMGPVHINVPFREPLYDLVEYTNYVAPKVIDATPITPTISIAEADKLTTIWNKYERIMVIGGSYAPNEQLQQAINKLTDHKNVTILTEVTANLRGAGLITTLDPALEAIEKGSESNYRPDLLVNFGGPIVSKKLKRFLRNHQPKEHWYVDESGDHTDTYQTLTNVIRLKAADFIDLINKHAVLKESTYKDKWLALMDVASQRHKEQLNQAPYCDLTAFAKVWNKLPQNSKLQLGNSTSVRYAGLFNVNELEGISINCNRGTSGIDGTISTAAGAAFVSNGLTTVITGDLSFFYDSNALWNNSLPKNLRIVVLNNQGGNIFRIIKGPSALPEKLLEQYFETQHNASIEYIAKAFNIPYYLCTSLEELDKQLPAFFQPDSDSAIVMEIRTPNDISANILKTYLKIS